MISLICDSRGAVCEDSRQGPVTRSQFEHTPEEVAYSQVIWRNMTTFFLSNDCSSWARLESRSAIGVFLAAGAQLQNSVTLSLDHGGATVQLPLVDKQDRQGRFT